MGASLDVQERADGRLSSKVRKSFSFLLFNKGDVGGGDYKRSLKPNWSKTGVCLRRCETDCANCIMSA